MRGNGGKERSPPLEGGLSRIRRGPRDNPDIPRPRCALREESPVLPHGPGGIRRRRRSPLPQGNARPGENSPPLLREGSGTRCTFALPFSRRQGGVLCPFQRTARLSCTVPLWQLPQILSSSNVLSSPGVRKEGSKKTLSRMWQREQFSWSKVEREASGSFEKEGQQERYEKNAPFQALTARMVRRRSPF